MNKILRYLGYIIFRPIWWIEKIIPRDRKTWVFGAWYGQKYSDNSKYVFEYVLEHHPEINAIWITKSVEVYNKLKEEEKKVFFWNSFRGIYSCLRAKYALLTSGVVDVNPFFLNGCKQIWLWHGMPLKKIGYCDHLNLQNKYKTFFFKLLNPYYKLQPHSTLTSSDFFIPFLQDAFHLLEKSVWTTGLPRCDAFFTNKKELFVHSIQEEYSSSKIYLYMPTFRMSSNMDGDVFSPFDVRFGFNEQDFITFLEEENIVLLYKPHFVDSSFSIEIESSRFKLLCDDDFSDLYILLNDVDVLITDYSSVYFDFLVTSKPIYLFTFDYDEYITKSRSHFFNMKDELNGYFCYSWQDFYNTVKNEDISLKHNLDKTKFAQYVDGYSCKRVYEMICFDSET